jgi:hypothetical protein
MSDCLWQKAAVKNRSKLQIGMSAIGESRRSSFDQKAMAKS